MTLKNGYGFKAQAAHPHLQIKSELPAIHPLGPYAQKS